MVWSHIESEIMVRELNRNGGAKEGILYSLVAFHCIFTTKAF